MVTPFYRDSGFISSVISAFAIPFILSKELFPVWAILIAFAFILPLLLKAILKTKAKVYSKHSILTTIVVILVYLYLGNINYGIIAGLIATILYRFFIRLG